MNRRARRAIAARKSGRVNFTTRIIPPRIRRGLLLGASGLTVAIALGVAHEAAAIDECGAAAGAPPSVTCKASGNPYPTGIRYDVDDLTIVVKNGVIVDTTTTAGEEGGIVSGAIPSLGTGTATGNLVLKVSPSVSITTDDDFADAVSVGSGGPTAYGGTGSVSITSQGTITTTGDSADGIRGVAYGGDVKVVASGSITTKGSIAGGIVTSSNLNTDHVLSVDSSAAITTSGEMSWGIRVDSELNTNVDVVIKSSGKITTSGNLAEGIYGSSSTGAATDSDVTITSSSVIVTTGEQSHGIRGYSNNVDSAIVISSIGKVSTSGNASAGILATAAGENSAVTVSSLAAIQTAGEDAFGIVAGSLEDNSDVLVVSAAKIGTTGDDASAILALSGGDNSDVMVTSIAALTTAGNGAYGIFTVTSGDNSKTTVVSTSDITTTDHEADGVHARASGAGSPVTIISTGNIATTGGEADGIDADTASDVSIVSTGKITTKQSESDGIEIESSGGNIAAGSSGAIVTAGSDADGIHALADSGDITISSTGTIKTTGGGSNGSEGIWAKSLDGAITITNNSSITTAGQASDAIHADASNAISITTKNASATGQNADGIDASNSLGTIGITVTGAVSGGWMGGHGIAIDAGGAPTVTINAGGSVGALNDLALQEFGQNLSLSNKGTITGVLVTGAGADTFANAGTWQLRAFRDTDGDGTRNNESVARVDFGFDSDTVNNTGTLILSSVSGATIVNDAGAIVDPFGTDGDITLAGVEQGQLLGLEQFTNTGTISLQDGTVGDFLAITDQSSVGAGGGGNFVSNGGSLKLDVYLDDGSSGKSDMLFLDNATTGKGGATRVFVNNTGGPGALTVGDGIQVINVDVSSSSDAFTLGAPVVAGAFQYDLEFQNLAATDQSWYLRSSPFAGALAYPSISSSALTTWRSDLAAFERRLDSLRLNMTAPAVTVPVVAGIAESGSISLDPARFTGGWFSMTESNDSVSQSGIAGFSQDTARAELGFDFALDNVSGNDDWLVLGAFGGQGWSQADFADADGSTDFDIAAMGVYASYFQGPYHMDALVKFDWLDGNYSSDAVSGDGDVELPVFGVSLSTGYRFDLTTSEAGGLSLQPVAALDYAHVGGDTFRDDSGATIELMEMDSLRGRLGAKLVQKLLPSEDGTGPVGNFYLSAGVAQEFLGESEARVTGVTLTQELPQTTLELGAGFDLALPEEGVSFTFGTSADFSEGEDSYAATGGVKFTW